MKPQCWEHVKTPFNEVLERSWQKRRALVTESCGGDQTARRGTFSASGVEEATPHITEMISSVIDRLVMSMAPRPPALGDVILDRFELVRRLGSGGMGDVYEAKDRELQQTVALKMIRPEIAGEESILALFKREVTLARRLSGPNICRIHELFVTRDKEGLVNGAFLTMEFLEGMTLADRLKRGPMPWREAHAIAMDICAGLATMHKAGIIHRDLKSCNIMLANRDGAQRAVLMDFGLAHELSKSSPTAETVLTIAGSVQGTPEYMAPEQLEGQAATAASDVYAMGIILYELATGKHPFASSNALGAAVLRGKRLAPASSVTRQVPRSWDVVIRTCLQYDATQRYESADELGRALNGNMLGVRVLQNRWSGFFLAVAASALIAACAWFTPVLREKVERVHLGNGETHLAVLPFDIAKNNPEASLLADELTDSLAGRLANLGAGNKTLWVVPPSEIRRRKVNDPGTALREFGATVVVEAHFSLDRGVMRLKLELIDSRRMREVGFAVLENREQDLLALQNEAASRLTTWMNGDRAICEARQCIPSNR